MALLGSAALAMWWDIAPEVRADFEDWHAHEHFPERLSIPGFQRATRWSCAEGTESMFVVYELSDFDVLSSAPYVARLNAPTPWSTRLMPHHRNMVRSQCQVLESRGGAVALHALTMRLSPIQGRDAQLRTYIKGSIDSVSPRPGVTGAHLLKHKTPNLQPTVEQRIRNNADVTADWVLMLCGYDRLSVEGLALSTFSSSALEAVGAAPGITQGLYTVSYSATRQDCE